VDGQVAELFAYWRERCDRPRAKLGPDRRAKIKARLAEGHTIEEIRRAIDGAASAPHVSDAGLRFDDIELVCRSGSKLELFIARAGLPQRVTAGGEQVRLESPPSAEETARWEEAAPRLCGEFDVDEQAWRHFLSGLHPHASPNGRLVLGTNPRVTQWVRQRYQSVVERAVGEEVEIVACGCSVGAKAA
jgi:hypothetical protein